MKIFTVAVAAASAYLAMRLYRQSGSAVRSGSSSDRGAGQADDTGFGRADRGDGSAGTGRTAMSAGIGDVSSHTSDNRLTGNYGLFEPAMFAGSTPDEAADRDSSTGFAGVSSPNPFMLPEHEAPATLGGAQRR